MKRYEKEFESIKRSLSWEQARRFELERLRSDYEDWQYRNTLDNLNRVYENS